jgi:hypothetical protein
VAYLPDRFTVGRAPFTVQGEPTPAMPQELRVEEPCAAWKAQAARWELIEALTGGTIAMRAKGKQYLPQEPKEYDDSYAVRLAGSVCPPYFQRLESMLTGMLTRKPLKLDGTPDRILEDLFDVDMRGNDLQRWLAVTARKLLRYGHIGVLVDAARPDEGSPTARPYWCTYSPSDIIGWRTEAGTHGDMLVQLRLHEQMVVPYGMFGEERVDQVRVLEPGAFRVYRRQASKSQDYELIDEGATGMDTIPFSIAYADQVDTLVSRPPLEEVAWLNLMAYQRSSDLANQLHRAAVPRLMLYGFPAEVEEIEAGPESATGAPVDARAEFLEPGGTSYDYQFRHLDQIEQQINQLGLAAVIGQKMAAETAMSKSIDRSQGDAALQVVAHQLQDMIDNCLRYHGAFYGDTSPGTCQISRDFVTAEIDPARVAQLIALETAGKITQETLLNMLSEGEWLGDDFDVEAEIAATEAMQAQRQAEMEVQLQAGMNSLPGTADREEGNLAST